MAQEHTMLVVGHARLPKNIPSRAIFETLFIVAKVDRSYGVIINADINLVSDITKQDIAALLIGYSLRDSVDTICNRIREHFHGMSASATIAAVRDLFKSYDMLVNGKEAPAVSEVYEA